VKPIPDRIEPGYFVGEEFGDCANCADAEHPRACKDIEHREIVRQWHDIEMHREASSENRHVEPPA